MGKKLRHSTGAFFAVHGSGFVESAAARTGRSNRRRRRGTSTGGSGRSDGTWGTWQQCGALPGSVAVVGGFVAFRTDWSAVRSNGLPEQSRDVLLLAGAAPVLLQRDQLLRHQQASRPALSLVPQGGWPYYCRSGGAVLLPFSSQL